jgi:hypothetical protein
LSGTGTTVDRTEAETRESERNRVAWNLPRKVTAAHSGAPQQAPKKSAELGDPTEEAPEDG